MSDYSKIHELKNTVKGDESTYTHVRITISHERICNRTYYKAYYTYVVVSPCSNCCTCERSYPFDGVNRVALVGKQNGYVRASKRALEEALNETFAFYNYTCLAGNEIKDY